MKQQVGRLRRIGLTVLLTGVLALAAEAQMIRDAGAVRLLAAYVPATPAGALTDVHPETLDAAEWKRLSKELTRQLGAPDIDVRAEALQNIIFFATNFGDQADFGRATYRLYNTYRFSREEPHRIMALAALHAVGDDNGMRLLAQHVPWEKSPRLRRLTHVALVDYYGVRHDPSVAQQTNR